MFIDFNSTSLEPIENIKMTSQMYNGYVARATGKRTKLIVQSFPYAISLLYIRRIKLHF